MRRRCVLALLVPIPARAAGQASTGAIEAGRWNGDARLFHAKTRARTGAIPAELLVSHDGTLSGQVGGAAIPATRPKRSSATRVEYQVVLEGRVHEALDPALDHLLVIVTRASGGGIDADFHLKRRFGFDPGMLVGHLDLVRAH